MTFDKVLRDSVVAQFGAEIQAGLHGEYPRLKRMWLESEMERAEKKALLQACVEVANGAENWLQD